MNPSASSLWQQLIRRLPPDAVETMQLMASDDRRRSGSGAASRPEKYDTLLWRARGRIREHFSTAGSRSIEQQIGDLVTLPAHRRREKVLAEPTLHTVTAVTRLLRESWDQRSVDPRESEHLADLALEVSGRLDPARVSTRLVHDLQARAWGQIGNARRIQSRLQDSEQAFQLALCHLEAGTQDILERALVSHWIGSLRRDQRDFPAAVRWLRRAAALFRQIHDDESRARTLITLGYTCREAGEADRGLAVLKKAEPLLPSDHPLLLHIRHNQIYFLVDLARYDEAEALLTETRPLYAHSPEPLTRLRLPWVEGRIAKHTGRLDEAEYLFKRVRDSFIEHGIAYDAALVSLELAEIFSDQGRTEELKQLAAEMVAVFRSRNVGRETLAALLMLHHAAAAEQATLNLIRDVARKLRRAGPSVADSAEQ